MIADAFVEFVDLFIRLVLFGLIYAVAYYAACCEIILFGSRVAERAPGHGDEVRHVPSWWEFGISPEDYE